MINGNDIRNSLVWERRIFFVSEWSEMEEGHRFESLTNKYEKALRRLTGRA